MRRKSERVKDKDKPVDKKSEKSSKKSRTRSSRRRKKSSSTSPESSETEDYDTSLRSGHDEAEEEYPSEKSKREKVKDSTPTPEVGSDEKVSSGRTRRASKKQTAEDEEQAQSELSGLQDDEKIVESTDLKGETSDQKHKDKEGKSSVWQVKSADCSSGEIKKLKLCIVRPPEPTELSPRKRKKLSRSSHRDLAEGDVDEGLARDSSGERRKSRKSLRNTSDDSTSPEKKGKHKSGDSSEDGQRTQDSEEMPLTVMKVSLDKPMAQEESSQDEIMTITTSEDKKGLREPFVEVHKASVPLKAQTEVQDPLEDQSKSPLVTFEEKSMDSPPQSSEKSIDSPIHSPEPSVEIPVDPFDALKSSDVKSIKKDNPAIVKDGPTFVADKVIPCDSTEELDKVADTVIEVEKAGSPEAKREVCDSSMEISKSIDSPEEVLITRASSEEREKSPDSIKEKAEEPLDVKPRGRELSEERPTAQSVDKNQIQITLEKSQSVEDSCIEKSNMPEASNKQIKVQETSKERRKARDSSEERPSARRSDEKRARETSEERSKDRRRLKPHDSPDHKSRSRRLNRYSTGDRESRHKTSRQKSDDVEVPFKRVNEVKELNSKKEDKDVDVKKKESEREVESKIGNENKEVHSKKGTVDVEVILKKDKENEEVSPKKSKEERDHKRTKVVWEEKPPVETKRPRPSVVNVSQSITSGTSVSDANQTPPKPREKITLKRSVSSKVKAVTEDVEDAKCSSVDGVKEEQTNCNVNHSDEPLSIVPRKRRWGAGKTNSVPKKPVLSISSDSLKSLIPEAKLLAMSEVQLTPEEAEEGEVDDSDPIPSDVEEEKVIEKEHSRDVKLVSSPSIEPESPTTRINIVLSDERLEKAGPAVRKISILSDEMRSLQRSPSPARHRVSNVLFITNLVRPFTLNQLKELLARTGVLIDGGFWIDKIKSKCYVQYASESEARETRHALHGVRWPVSNPKQLSVDYAKQEELDMAKEMADGGQIPRKTEPLKVVEWEAEREKERERLGREREKLERDRLRGKEVDRERDLKMSGNIREWDLGKLEAGSFEDGREDRNKEREKRIRKDRDYRSPSPRDGPVRKIKKKEEDAPAKLLDDLFKKTKFTPCIYWLPLTAEQIVVKEEMRRKHMAEHERRMAEMRKAERGGRNQGRPPPRNFPDKRKRRSLSGSPNK